MVKNSLVKQILQIVNESATFKFYRLQPPGLEINSTAYCSSSNLLEGTFVFDVAWQIFNTDTGNVKDYGDKTGVEVVEILATEYYDPGDIEGVIVLDGKISRRWSLDEFAKYFGYDNFVDAQEAFNDGSMFYNDERDDAFDYIKD